MHNLLQRDTSARISQLCAWLPPSTKNVPFAPISDTDFTSPSTKRNRIMTGFASKNRQTKVSVPPPSQAEISNFYSNLAKTGKPALLSIDPEYSDAYVLDYDLLSSCLHLDTQPLAPVRLCIISCWQHCLHLWC